MGFRSMLFAVIVVFAGCTSTGTDPPATSLPPAYESSTRFSVQHDEADEVLLLSKPPPAVCFWVQRWSAQEREWLVVGSIPDNGIVHPGIDEVLGTKDITDPGCDDVELAPAPLWSVPFSHAIPGIYRVVWLSEGEYSAPIEIL